MQKVHDTMESLVESFEQSEFNSINNGEGGRRGSERKGGSKLM